MLHKRKKESKKKVVSPSERNNDPHARLGFFFLTNLPIYQKLRLAFFVQSSGEREGKKGKGLIESGAWWLTFVKRLSCGTSKCGHERERSLISHGRFGLKGPPGEGVWTDWIGRKNSKFKGDKNKSYLQE